MPPGADGLELAGALQGQWLHVLLLIASAHRSLSDGDIPDVGVFVAKTYPDQKIVGQIGRLIAVSAVVPKTCVGSPLKHD